ncbi:glucuronate isomerase [Pontibacter pamirensis]|uniref:glucuronate isomerase n=1 Tax=Pontibacter pamirensis TaxID=2562824 RepID=UPI00138A11A8|nr:glucuronate isomerase [Pontibacter pamirensis]
MNENELIVPAAAERRYSQPKNGFMSEDFLLQTETARLLYHEYARELPIIDYHCHLSPKAIAENKPYANMTEIWLAGDHYKWRALRTLGIEEKYITGDATDEEKFKTWAKAVPYTMRNPLYHWTHMELKNPFGVTELLTEENASEVYAHCNGMLQKPEFTPKGLLQHFGVEMVGTTDDPIDNLEYHQQIAASGFNVKVLPSFRPDKALNLAGGEAFRGYLQKLSEASGITVSSIDTLLEALQQRVDFFHANGCRVSDHGLSFMPFSSTSSGKLEKVFAAVLDGNDQEVAAHEQEFACLLLMELCKMYHEKGWVQQFHLGALRNNNTRMLQVNGPDTGYDSIGDYPQAMNMTAFFNALEKEDKLAKTVIYNLNPADNAAFAAMTGNFQSAGIKGKIQFGSGWWFLDQLDGMKEQMNTLSNMGLISCFIGMLTDSRSFLSYPRHEYFRRLLCNMFGDDIEQGLLPADIPWVGKMVQDICYNNARNYFTF